MLTNDWTDDDFAAADTLCAELGGKILDFLAVIYVESGAHSWALNDNPKNKPPEERYNAAGLNQCMPFILASLGFRKELSHRTRAEEFCKLSVGQQLPYIREYFRPYRGKLTNISAWYLANFLPKYIDKAGEPDCVLADRDAGGFSGAVWAANRAFDANGDGKITVRELRDAVLRNCVGARWMKLAARASGIDRDGTVMLPMTTLPPPARPDLRTWLGIQTALVRLGYESVGSADGVLGPKTRQGILDFQKGHPPLVADGIYGPKTRKALEETLAELI